MTETKLIPIDDPVILKKVKKSLGNDIKCQQCDSENIIICFKFPFAGPDIYVKCNDCGSSYQHISDGVW